jgi:hypothetical protein
MKTCRLCKTEKPKSEYHSHKTAADRMRSECKACTVGRNARKYLKAREACRKNQAEWRIRNPGYASKWNKQNRGRKNYLTMKRIADQLNATPKWLTKQQLKEIDQMYKNCPEGYEVDHMYPLRGKEISGLHVPWNLQYLTESENRSKNNRLIPIKE